MSRIAFIFPGQGAQKAGMGKDFYEKYPASARVFEQVSHWLDLDMPQLCFEENDKLDLYRIYTGSTFNSLSCHGKSSRRIWPDPGGNGGLKPRGNIAPLKQLAESA